MWLEKVFSLASVKVNYCGFFLSMEAKCKDLIVMSLI